MPRRLPLRRFLHRFLGALGATLVFSTTFLVSLVLHGDLPSSRRFLAQSTTRLLAPFFRGRIVIREIEHLGFDGVDIRLAEVIDPWEQRILSLHGVHARLPLARALRRFALGAGSIHLSFEDVHIDQMEVNLDIGPEMRLRLQSAFAPRTSPQPSASTPRPLQIELPRVVVERGLVRGEPVPGFPLEAEGLRIPTALRVTERSLELDIERFGARTRLLSPLDPQGTADYHLRLAAGQEPRMWASFHGRLGEVTLDASASLEGLRISGRLETARVEPDHLRSLLPQVPLRGDIFLRGELSGTFPDLHVSGRLLAGSSGEATFEADARLVQGIEVYTRWSLRDMDPRLFSASAPAASLGGDGKVWLRQGPGGLRAEAEVSTFPFTLGEHVLPSVSAQASFDGVRLQGKAKVYEPGVDNDIVFRVGLDRKVEVEARMEIPQLRSVTRLHGIVEGTVKAHMEARLSPEGVLEAIARGNHRSLKKGPVRVAEGGFQVRLGGTLDRLNAEAAVTGEQVDLGGFRVQRVVVGAAGPLRSPAIHLAIQDERWRWLSLSAGVRLRPSPSLENLRLRFQGDEQFQIEAQVARVAVAQEGVSFQGLQVRGPVVQARGNLNLGSTGFHADLQDGRVNLALLGRYLGPHLGAPALARISSGVLTFDGKIDADGAHRQGNLNARITNLCSREYPVIWRGEGHLGLSNEQVSATFSTELFQATCKMALENPEIFPQELMATARVQSLGRLRGPLLNESTWKNATGSIELTELTVHLDQLSRHPLVEKLRQAWSKGPMAQRIPRFSGLLGVTATLSRVDPRQLPSFQLALISKHLRMEASQNEGGPWLVEGLDLRAGLALIPAPTTLGSLEGATQLALVHGDRELLQLSAATILDPKEAREALTRLSSPTPSTSAPALAWLRSRPIRGKLLIHEQAIEDLPALLRPLPLQGKVRLEVALAGTVDRPEITVQADVRSLHKSIQDWDPWRMDALLQATLDERGLVLRGEMRQHAEGIDSTEGRATFWGMSTLRLGDLLWGRRGRWQADGEARLFGWHLGAIPMLAERGIQGRVSGVIQAFRFNVQPQLWADLTLEGGKLADVAMAPVHLMVSLVEGGGFASITLRQPGEQPGEPGGELALTAFPTVTFRDRRIPTLDRRQRHPISLRLSRFDLKPFAPLAAPLLADLRGKLDGEFSLVVSPKPTENSITGGLRWSRGVLLVPQLGQTFTDGQFNVSTTPSPGTQETKVNVRAISLAATSGRINGEASFIVPNDLLARYLFPPADGSEADPVLRGDFSASIAPREKIPITFEGIALGDAYGKTEGTIQFRKQELQINVAIPQLTFELPETTGRQNLQDLNENPQIAIVEASRRIQRRRQQEDDTPLVVRVQVGLGSSLEDLLRERSPNGSVLVRRASVDVHLAGVLHSTLASDLTVTGTVETLSGRIVALGKPFNIRRGFVRFEGQATNPYLNVGATWDSPEGTKVFADLQGYLKEAQLRLRSEPTLTESEVLSLVLFGRDPASNARTNLGPSSDIHNSLAVGGSVASTLLNSFLDPVQVFGRRIETRVEATSSRGTSIGVAAEIRPRLWAQVDISTSTQRERQNSDLSTVTLDWRFRPNWSLRTTVGDRGSSLMELLWQFKY
ncbi:MAG: translocation/assembly module TamB domain-containing protein [Myxococcales bacterium]|nr:translocation/assembly module TamB [Polyangiaceae bacterium]MDW8249067.1 translocation/assembly module TamB domain-containing protein [Myxococcales bacterium]